jgi:hypothetical protein
VAYVYISYQLLCIVCCWCLRLMTITKQFILTPLVLNGFTPR